jgi:hypothetical protein
LSWTPISVGYLTGIASFHRSFGTREAKRRHAMFVFLSKSVKRVYEEAQIIRCPVKIKALIAEQTTLPIGSSLLRKLYVP